MELPIFNIGNSKGIRLPKAVLEKYGIRDKVELILEQGYIILKPKPEPRKNWEVEFKSVHETVTTNY